MYIGWSNICIYIYACAECMLMYMYIFTLYVFIHVCSHVTVAHM